jgi:SAM-dependent methyltransferase
LVGRALAPEPPDPGQPFDRIEGRHVFGPAAAVYAAARPGYPDRVYEILRDRCGVGPSSRILEIGPGTGQATKRLLSMGGSVVAIEPSHELADRLRVEVGGADGFDVVEAPFEDADLASSSFDLVASATAFHWLDPEVALPKIAAVLRPEAWLASWWNVFGDPDRPDPFHDATERVLGDLAPGPSSGRGGVRYALDIEARIAELAGHGFLDVEHEAVRWTLVLDATRTRQLYATFSNVARVPEPTRETILDELRRIAEVEFGGRVERNMVTPIYTAHR